MTMTKYGSSPVATKPETLEPAELAVLTFLREHPGKFTTEEVGRQVRHLVLKRPAKAPTADTAPVCSDARVVRNWASTVLNKLHRKNLVFKEGTKGHNQPMRWWITLPPVLPLPV